jgi:hypothetical protein
VGRKQRIGEDLWWGESADVVINVSALRQQEVCLTEEKLWIGQKRRFVRDGLIEATCWAEMMCCGEIAPSCEDQSLINNEAQHVADATSERQRVCLSS